jgi:hypothetical protein
MIENDTQLSNTLHKLELLRQRIAESRREALTPERTESVESLELLARQLNEEIVRYRSAKKLNRAM